MQTTDTQQRIQALILDSASPGERIPTERQLAERLGVSRNSVREAVKSLTAMGLLSSRVGSGTYVTALDATSLLAGTRVAMGVLSHRGLSDVLETRRLLEAEAARLAALRRTPEHLDALREALAQMQSAARPAEGLEADIAFHDVVAAASGNAVLAGLVRALNVTTRVERGIRADADPEAGTAMHVEHRLILEAVERGDGAAAAAAAAAHTHNLERWLTRSQEHPPV